MAGEWELAVRKQQLKIESRPVLALCHPEKIWMLKIFHGTLTNEGGELQKNEVQYRMSEPRPTRSQHCWTGLIWWDGPFNGFTIDIGFRGFTSYLWLHYLLLLNDKITEGILKILQEKNLMRSTCAWDIHILITFLKGLCHEIFIYLF